MTPFLAFLLAQTGPKTIELSDTSAQVAVQIHMTTTEDDPALPVFGKLVEGQSGVRVVVLPGMARIEALCAKDQAADTVAGLCNALSPVIDETSSEAALKVARIELASYVVQARWGGNPIGDGDPDQLLSTTWRHATAPGSFFVVGQGDFGRDGLRGMTSALPWPGNRRPPVEASRSLQKPVFPEGVEAVQWRGPAVKPGSIEWTETLVALCALGCGPGGTLQTVCRKENPWSYDQDAVLWPTKSGPLPVVTVFRKSGSDLQPAQIQAALVKSIDGLTEADLARAVHMAKIALAGDSRWSPLLMEPDRAYQATISDKVAWRGFAEIWTSSTSLPSKFVQPCEQVTLARLKDTCRNLLADSRRTVLD
jgi:hypothetical protein